jgi:hypothetical protein
VTPWNIWGIEGMPPGILNFGTRGSADDREGKPVKITGARLSGRGPRPLCLANVFVFHGTIIIYRLYRLSLSGQTQVTRQLRFSVNIWIWSALAARPEKVYTGTQNCSRWPWLEGFQWPAWCPCRFSSGRRVFHVLNRRLSKDLSCYSVSSYLV